MQEDLRGVCRKREGGRERRMGVCYNWKNSERRARNEVERKNGEELRTKWLKKMEVWGTRRGKRC